MNPAALVLIGYNFLKYTLNWFIFLKSWRTHIHKLHPKFQIFSCLFLIGSEPISIQKLCERIIHIELKLIVRAFHKARILCYLLLMVLYYFYETMLNWFLMQYIVKFFFNFQRAQRKKSISSFFLFCNFIKILLKGILKLKFILSSTFNWNSNEK